MSYYCGLEIRIKNANAGQKQVIMNALAGLTHEEGWQAYDEKDGHISMEYDRDQCVSWDRWSPLWEGEGREEIARTIWRANGGGCGVQVIVRALEECPYEESEFDEDDYDEMMDDA
jgi:hypothetical protein